MALCGRAWSGFVACDAAALHVAGVAQRLTSTFVLRGRRGTYGIGWRAWSGFVARDAAAVCVAGVVLGDIHLHFTWQVWHKLTSTVGFAWQAWHLWHTFVLRGRRGTYGIGWRPWSGFVARDAAAVCVAGVVLGDIHLHFSWQAWHKLTSTVVLRGRRGTYGIGWRAWSGFVARDAAAVCVAGVVLGDIHLHFSWQHGTNSHPPSFCVAGVVLGDIRLHFSWQAWHKLTSTVVLRGMRGTYGIPSFCVAGVALMALGGALWSGFVARDAAAVCVAGVVLGDIHLHFTWQAWHKLTSTVVLRGRRGTYGIPSFCVAGVALMALGGALGPDFVARDAAAVCVAGVVLGDIHLHFTWQVWHKLTSTVVLRGRRGTYGIPSFCVAGVALMALGGALGPDLSPVTPRLFARQAWHLVTSTFISRGRRGTNSHPPSFCVAGTHTYTHTYIHTDIHTYIPFYLLDLSPPPLSFLPSLSPLKPLKLIIGRS